MAGTVWEFFGFQASDRSESARDAATSQTCPFLGSKCEKRLSDGAVAGVCTVKPVKTGPVICCPVRLYADDYQILRDVADRAFAPGLPLEPGRLAISRARATGKATIAVFGKRWGGELRLPQKDGTGAYFVDWVLALLDGAGELLEFCAIEVQTIDTTGNYRPSRAALMADDRAIVQSTVGLNWENVSKRILPQLIYKGQVLQREALCKKGLFFVCPTPVYDRIVRRLGGPKSLISHPLQPASITFLTYGHDASSMDEGAPVPLLEEVSHTTTVYRVQESFNNVELPEENVYKSAIVSALNTNEPNAASYIPE